MIEIGRQLEIHGTPERINVPVVGTYAASGTILLLMGIVFFGTGSSISMMGLGWIPVDAGKVHVPMGILTLAGLVFALPGLMLLFSGIKQKLGQARIRELQARHPDQAWAWDGDWDGKLLMDRGAARLWTSMIGVGFLSCFAGVFHYVGFYAERAPSLFLYASLVIDLVFVIAAFVFVRNLLRLSKHGRGRIRLSTMPLLPGKPCELQFSLGSDISLFDSIHLDLAFVEEKVIQAGRGNNRSRQLIAETRLRETRDIELRDEAQGIQGSLEIVIHLPESSPTTQLTAAPSKSWQLGIHLKTVGLDYKGRFLLPVYRMGRATISELAPIQAKEEPVSVH